MTPLDALLESLAEDLAVVAAGDGLRILVDEVTFDLPIETRLSGTGLRASLPRGLRESGFDAPLGRLRARLVEQR